MVKSVIVHSPAGVEIVTKPYLVGAELEALALQASTDFVNALDGAASFENPVSLEILNGCVRMVALDSLAWCCKPACRAGHAMRMCTFAAWLTILHCVLHDCLQRPLLLRPGRLQERHRQDMPAGHPARQAPVRRGYASLGCAGVGGGWRVSRRSRRAAHW